MSAEPAERPQRQRRRWWSLSLRALMVGVLLVGGALGWLARRAHLQRRAVAALTAKGGRITFDWAMADPANGQTPRKEPPGPVWLHRWIGDEFFQEVAIVALTKPTSEDMALLTGFDHLDELIVADVSAVGAGFGPLAGKTSLRHLRLGTPGRTLSGLTDSTLAPVGRLTTLEGLQIHYAATLTDAGLDSLQSLTRLTTLNLNGCPSVTSAGIARLVDHLPLLERLELPSTQVGDAALAAIGRLPHLKALNLTDTDITDAGMADLSRLPNLETLQIRGTALGDVGLAHLASLTTLQRLIAGGTRITDAGLVHLNRMANLMTLELTGTPITDAGLIHLTPLHGLRSLTLTTTPITDAATPTLARLSGLRVLALTKTKVTDAGLPPLAALTQLESLHVQETTVTAEGEADLRRRLPTLRTVQRGAYARTAGARPVPARSGRGGSTPAQPLRPEAANRPDRSARPTPTSKTTRGTAVGSTSAPQGQGGVLARLKDKHRPIIVFAPASDDDRATRQRHAWVGPLPEAGIKDRDIVVVEINAGGGSTGGGPAVIADEATELRRTFGVADDAFAVVLVGRDGGEKARWTEPVSPQEVFGRIDGMPMRQQEVEQKGGH